MDKDVTGAQTAPSAAMPATSDDLFLGGALQMRQPKSGYRAGLDAVLLAAACPAVAGETCLDCGAGVGVAGLAAARRIEGLDVTLIEKQADLAALATFNIGANDLLDRCRVVCDDLSRPLSLIGGMAAMVGRFDHVLANPPYHSHGRGTRATDPLKDGSHAMQTGAFEAWARFAAGMAANGATFTLIQRAAALPDVLKALDRRFGRIRVLPLHARDGEPASRVLVQAIKGSRAGLEILQGRVLHISDSHAFTAEFDAILRGGGGLDMVSA